MNVLSSLPQYLFMNDFVSFSAGLSSLKPITDSNYSPQEALLFHHLFHQAAIDLNSSFLEALLAHSPSLIDQFNDAHQTPLMSAVNFRCHQNVRFLIQQGANIHLTNHNQVNVLMLAARLGDQVTGQIVIEAGIGINDQDIDGWTALHRAVVFDHLDFVQFLLHHGADPFIKNESQQTPAELASSWGHSELSQFLKIQEEFHILQSSLSNTSVKTLKIPTL